MADRAGITADKPANAAAASLFEVVAEGRGETPEAAVKDAFQTAVRQAVGLVVDSETLVRNDELIKDEVLTYSDGIVKQYDLLSESTVDGLRRVHIRATVERRSLVARLEAANVHVKTVDGAGLFAEAVSRDQARKDATALVAKALAGTLDLLTAQAGKPVYDDKTGQVVVDVTLSVDRAAYDAHIKRLEHTLSAVTLRKVTAFTKAEAVAGRTAPSSGNDARPLNFFELSSAATAELAGPSLAQDAESAWCLWVCSFVDPTMKARRWNGYVLDADVRTCLAPLSGLHSLNVSLLDDDGGLITEQEVRFGAMQVVPNTKWSSPVIALWNRAFFGRDRSRPGEGLKDLSNRHDNRENDAINVFISPFAMTKGISYTDGFGESLYDFPVYPMVVRIDMRLDDLKTVTQVRAAVTFERESSR